MKQVKEIVLILVVVLATVLGAIDNQRIFGGFRARKGQFPHQVSIQVNFTGEFEHNCGGSIITNKFIVTAGHCFLEDFPYDLKRYKLILGAHNRTDDGTEIGIEQNFIHPDWNVTLIINDIALIQTDREIVFNRFIQPIAISREFIEPGHLAVTSGWGVTDDGITTLKYARVITLTNDDCRQRYEHVPAPIHDFSTLCVYSGSEGTGVCSGDSGGPLVYKGKLIGVTSWAHPCALGDPDGFCRISEYIEWIERVINATGTQAIL